MAFITKLFGAPGCGKTTRLMEILMQELKTVEPEHIAYVSFTRKGTYEGAQRAIEQYSLTEKRMPFFRTLHSIAFRAGNCSKYDMIGKHDFKKFSEAMGLRMTGFYTEEFFSSDDIYLFLHFLKRNNAAAAESYMDRDINMRIFNEVEHNYRRYKTWAKKQDFTDIIENFILAGKPLPVEVAIIDEAQDLTTLQWQMCEIAFANCQRIYIAGDDDQAIYEWSGADVNYFLKQQADATEILAKSYRLQSQCLELSKQVTQKISYRVDKDFLPVGDNGSVKFYNSVNELELNNESWYFLARNNIYLSAFRSYIQKQAAIYMDKDKLSYEPKHIEAIKVYEQLRKQDNIKDDQVLKLRLLFGDSIDFAKPWFETIRLPNDLIAYYRDLFKFKPELVKTPSISVNTIHGVKGGEADNVVVGLDFTRAVKRNMEYSPDAELRCLYVGLTRAKKNLHIINAHSKNSYSDYITLRG